MNISCYESGFPFIVIDDYYNQEEYDLIWQELNFLCHKSKLVYAQSSAHQDGQLLKNNYCRYLDYLYTDRSVSSILTVNRKLFQDSYQILRTHPSWFFQNVRGTIDKTSVSYYENGEKYLPHWDEFTLTALWWTYKQPKKFGGGEFIFSNTRQSVEIKDNRMLIFPSMIPHEVTEVTMNQEDLEKQNGRICIAQFLSYKSD